MKVQIKNADMNEVLQSEVVELAKTAMDRFNTEKDTHETKHFVYFYIDELAVLCYKAG